MNVIQQSKHQREAANNTKEPSATTKQQLKNQSIEEDITRYQKRVGLFTTLPLHATVLNESEFGASVVIRESDEIDELAGEVGMRYVALGK